MILLVLSWIGLRASKSLSDIFRLFMVLKVDKEGLTVGGLQQVDALQVLFCAYDVHGKTLSDLYVVRD